MNDIAAGKAKLRQALLEVSRNYVDTAELASEESVSYSPSLEKKMSRLLKYQKSPCRKLFNAPYKRTIAACLAVLIFTGVLIGCKPIREPVVEFFTEIYEAFTEFFFDHEEKTMGAKTIDEFHTFAYLPEGYELTENPTIAQSQYEKVTVWENEDGNFIIFSQRVLNAKIVLDTEKATTKILDNGTKIYIVNKNNIISVFWNIENYSYSVIANDLPEKELLKVINFLK